MQGTNPLTMQCTYSTPCGWCTKWNKECDKKMYTTSYRIQHPKPIKPLDESLIVKDNDNG